MIDVFDEIKSMMRANFPLIYLTTTEYGRVTQKLRTLCFSQNIKFNIWDAVDGLLVHEKDSSGRLVDAPHEAWGSTQDSYTLLEWIYRELIETRKDATPEVFLLEDCHPYFSEKKYPELLRKLATQLKFFNKHIVFVGPYTKLPIEIGKYITIVNIDLPDRDDLRIRLRYVAGKDYIINPDLEKFIIDSALGLTDTEADLAFRLAKEKVGLNRSECVQIIANEKEQIIKKSGILDYIPVNMSLNETVGGLENLKKWLTLRSKAFELKAKEFGLPEPKGILLLGVPGCGKSLTAKCIASEWKQPLLKLDIGKVFQAEVGSSENNIRQALATAEAIAPCILWIDEIEKGLSTSGGERDGGTNSRVFSTILTWMQEKKKPVFIFIDLIDFWMKHYTKHSMKFGPLDIIDKLDVPLLMLHSKMDLYSRPLYAEKLFNKSGSKVKELVWFDTGKHSMIRINNIKLNIDDNDLEGVILKKLKIKKDSLKEIKIRKNFIKSILIGFVKI